MRSPLIIALLGTALVAAGLDYDSGRGGTTMEGPLVVNGAVTMTSGPMTLNGPLTAGPTVTLRGPTTTTGSFAFEQPPTGLVRKGTLTRGASLGLAIGCQTLGTVAVTGTTLDSGCMVTNRPASLINLGVVLDCHVTSPSTVVVRACSLVALLSAPAGTYGVTLVGE